MFDQTVRLQQLGAAHGTDKHDQNHSFAGRSYLDIYEMYLGSRRWMVERVVEIGVLTGASLRMWRDYFPRAQVIGLDIDPARAEVAGERISVVTGSQSDPEAIERVMWLSGQPLDFILDDGSHVNDLTVASFNLLVPHLRPGGLYVIEDLACSYLGPNLENHIPTWPGMQFNQIHEWNNDRAVMDRLFAEKIAQIDLRADTDVEFVHFWTQICIVGKRSDR
ncbi:MAG: class I SAM-dependent methyltransferase [Chloroflexota bacterium]